MPKAKDGFRYVSNFEGEDINDRRYKLGEEIDTDDVDAGTLAYLTGNGRITQVADGDPLVPSGGAGEVMLPYDGSGQPVANMSRSALITELATNVSDDQLREAVASKRDREGEARAPLMNLEPDEDGEGATEADKFIARKLDEISDEEIAALTPEQRDAVIKAEKDRETPRKGLLSRLGVEAE